MEGRTEPDDGDLGAARLGLQRVLALLLLGLLTPLGMGITFLATPEEAPGWAAWVLAAIPAGLGYAVFAPLWRGPGEDGTPSWRKSLRISLVVLVVSAGTLVALTLYEAEGAVAGTFAAVCGGTAGIGIGGLVIGILHAGRR